MNIGDRVKFRVGVCFTTLGPQEDIYRTGEIIRINPESLVVKLKISNWYDGFWMPFESDRFEYEEKEIEYIVLNDDVIGVKK